MTSHTLAKEQGKLQVLLTKLLAHCGLALIITEYVLQATVEE